MNRIADMRLMLSKCRDCLGCNRMEDEKFIGDNNCGTGQVDGEWKHYCPECQESEGEEG